MGNLVAQCADGFGSPFDGLIVARGLDGLDGARYRLQNFGVNLALDLCDLADAALEVVQVRAGCMGCESVDCLADTVELALCFRVDQGRAGDAAGD